MQTIILEGMATSGKSTIVKMLESAVPAEYTLKIVPETETIMAIESNEDKEVSVSYLKKLIQEAYKSSHDLVIFDRLYLTHIFRVHGTIEDFSEIESTLLAYNPTTIFLEVDENAIAERVEMASRHRNASWKSYISTKGETFTEIADYYINQQRIQKKLLTDSRVPYKIYNTSSHDYEKIVQDILLTVQAT